MCGNERRAALEAAPFAAQVAVARFGLPRFGEGRVVMALIDGHYRVVGTRRSSRRDDRNNDNNCHGDYEKKRRAAHDERNNVPRQPQTALHVAAEADLRDRVASNDCGIVDFRSSLRRVRCEYDIGHIDSHLRARTMALRRGGAVR